MQIQSYSYTFDENGDDPRYTGIDSSGNNNHGTITGAKYVSGLVGVDNTTLWILEQSSVLMNLPKRHLYRRRNNQPVTNPSFEHVLPWHKLE